MHQNYQDINSIYADGEMADITRAFDWSATPVGPIAEWPLELITVVNLVLDSSFPMFIWWGKEMTQFYNDAYLKILGTDENSKHPKALGQRGEDCWPEIWDNISPLIRGVMENGKAVYRENQLIPIYRNGILDNVYWTFSYNPIRGQQGTPQGVLVVCSETTQSTRQLQQKEAELNRVMDHMAEGVGITDKTGHITYSNPMSHQILNTDPSLFSERSSNSSEWYNTHLDGRPMLDSEHPTHVAMATRKPVFGFEFAIERPGSNKIILVMNAAPIIDALGNVTGSVAMFSDITVMKNAEAVIAESEERFRMMAENSGVFIGMGDKTGGVTYFNKAWSTLTGKPLEELLGFGWAELIHPDDKEEYLRLYRDSIEKMVAYTAEYRILSSTGKYKWLLAFATPRFKTDGSFDGFIGSNIDITDRKNNEQRKNDFISMVSHELKTPLTSTIGFLQMAQRKAAVAGDPLAISLLDRSHRQLEKMTTLINGFLNVSRLEAGKIYIDKKYFDMAVLMKEVEDNMFPDGATHRVIFAPVEETWVNVDKDKIEQVINNLISNAVKYSPPNTNIQVACITKGDFAYVSVKDEGIGIKPSDQEKLFERFYRVEGHMMESISGFGIGLYLSKEIIDRHDGEIGVDSVVGKGSTFWFTIPISLMPQ